ncbi:Amino_acid transporter [Hexamita inflata]|uniref:Putative n=1 Tax=Hexamita inflata TaxID=28002 RepID=A0ABP1HK04_9EUKA
MSKQMKKTSSKIGILQLTLITYFLICAGPYGIEETVQATGPFYALLATAVLPIVLSLPLSMLCSEMGSIFPQRGSTIIWASSIIEQMKKGRAEDYNISASKAKLITSKILSRFYTNFLVMKAVCVNAIPPSLICGYLANLIPDVQIWYFKILVTIVSFVLVGILNVMGIDGSGWAQYGFAAFVLTPVFIFVAMSGPYWETWKVEPKNKPASMDFGLLFSNLVWQCTGFDQSANLSGEVDRPQFTYPVSLILVVFLVIVSFFVPIISGVMIEPNSEAWHNGAFSQISLRLKGCESGWLQYWFIIAGAISSLSVLNAYVTCTSRELYCNASNGLLPFGKWIAKLRSFKKKARKVEQVADVEKPDEANEGYIGEEELQRALTETFINSGEEEDLSYVPFASILVVSICPIFMQLLSFEELLTVGSFLIGCSMFCQLILFWYQRHGKYGYWANNEASPTQFHVKGGYFGTIAIILTPLISCVLLWYFQGWQPLVVIAIGQLILFGLYGLESLVGRKQRVVTGYDLLQSESQVKAEI